MATKNRQPKQKVTAKDREENRKFLIVVALATVALMLLMYFIYVR